MQRSNDRILTTHAGRLLASNNLGQITPSAGAQPNRDDLVPAIREGIREVVHKQVAAGIDIISDGEIGKIGGVTYFGPRMNGIERKIPSGDGPAMMSQRTNERIEFADFYATLGNFRNTSPERLVCVAPLSFKGDGEIQSDIRLFADELDSVNSTEQFMCALAPGWIEHGLWNEYYKTDEEFLFAIAEAMRPEYQRYRRQRLHSATGRPGTPRHVRHDRAVAIDRGLPQVRRAPQWRPRTMRSRASPKIACATTSAGAAGTARTRTTCP